MPFNHQKTEFCPTLW